MALAWSFESLDTPIFSATRRALRVLAPVAHVSAAAATRARSTRRQRSIASPGKKLPVRSLGMRGVSVPAQVASALSRQPFRLFAPPPRSWSASASITAFATCSARRLSSSCMSMAPSSGRGMAGMSGVGSDKIPVAVSVLSQNLLLLWRFQILGC